jgi:membrane protease subunit HflC
MELPKLPIKLNGTFILGGVCFLIIAGELLLGNGGCVEVEPGEVAVIYNNTGLGIFGDPQRTVIEQGALTFLPGIQTVHVLERRPQLFVMAADSVGGQLTVRANDGSNFYFDRLEIHYQIDPPQAGTVIATSGPGDGYEAQLIATHAREILRDEFGRYDFLEIANPGTYGAATTEAKERLNERLADYGVQVTQIVTPKPKFEARVEKAIEDRQGAEQEVEVQEEKRRKLELEKGLKIQSVEQEKNAEYQTLLAELEAKKKASSNKLLSIKREADKYAIDTTAQGEAYRQEKVTRAKANEVAYRKEAEGLVAKITAVGAAGPDVLNRVIAEKVFPQMQNISATPRIKQVTPLDIRHIQGGEQ